jgi:hypothetical protein
MTSVLDVIIVSHNTRVDVLNCLASLHGARPAGLGRIIVVDNGSQDDSVAAIRSAWPDVTIVALDTNAGFGAANNLALRHATSALVLFLNSDTVVPAGAIETLVERLDARQVTAAGPRLVGADGRPEISYGRMLTPWTELVQRARVRIARRSGRLARRYVASLTTAERLVDWVSGACLLARRADVVAAGGFDERFFLYEEDVDLCASLRARGGRILFTPHTTVVHLRGRSAGGAGAAPGASHYDRSHLAFYAKHAPRWVPWLERWLRLRGRAIR